MKFCPDFATNPRKEWRVSLFQSTLRKQIGKLPKILKSVKIPHYSSLLFIRVLRPDRGPRCSGAIARRRGWRARLRRGRGPWSRLRQPRRRRRGRGCLRPRHAPSLKGSIGEGSNFSHQSSVKILSKFTSEKIQEFSLENSKISENFNINFSNSTWIELLAEVPEFCWRRILTELWCEKFE